MSDRDEVDSLMYMYKVGFIDGTRECMKAHGATRNLQDKRIWAYIKKECMKAWDNRFFNETKKRIRSKK